MIIEINIPEEINSKIKTLEEENVKLKSALVKKEEESKILKLSVDSIFREKSILEKKYEDLVWKCEDFRWQILIIDSVLRKGKKQ